MSCRIIKPKRGTPTEWRTANPILAYGEIAIETCNEGCGKGFCNVKIGDGITPWNNLPYAIKNYSSDIDALENKINDRITGTVNSIYTDLNKVLLPSLSIEQKNKIQWLINEYYANKSKFAYLGNTRRESYCYPIDLGDDTSGNYFVKGCMSNGKYLINCGVLVQFILMGRDINDFINNPSTPTTSITKSFDWGYYFDFLLCKIGQDLMYSTGDRYFPYNTYTVKTTNSSGDVIETTKFTPLDGASAMAEELYRKGCEINPKDLEIGDLVFYHTQSEIDGEDDEVEQAVFRGITHVGIVYDFDSDNNPVVFESTDAWSNGMGFIGLGEHSKLKDYSRIRAVGYHSRTVMCARNPIAFGYGSNVPDTIEKYRGVLGIKR